MRKQIVAGNWKMNLTISEGKNLCNSIIEADFDKCKEVILIPPYLHLESLLNQTKDTQIKISAQNCHYKLFGAYTGEISPSMLFDMGIEYVLLGHSERRSYFNEKKSIIASKLTTSLSQGLKVIFCCGESFEKRNSGDHFKFISQQIQDGLFHLNSLDIMNIIIAYEPIWAIGTGETATSNQAQEMHKYIRKLLSEHYGNDIANKTPIIYGGSCNSSNACDLFSQEDVDGGLVGGASLCAEDFISIINS